MLPPTLARRCFHADFLCTEKSNNAVGTWAGGPANAVGRRAGGGGGGGSSGPCAVPDRGLLCTEYRWCVLVSSSRQPGEPVNPAMRLRAFTPTTHLHAEAAAPVICSGTVDICIPSAGDRALHAGWVLECWSPGSRCPCWPLTESEWVGNKIEIVTQRKGPRSRKGGRALALSQRIVGAHGTPSPVAHAQEPTAAAGTCGRQAVGERRLGAHTWFRAARQCAPQRARSGRHQTHSSSLEIEQSHGRGKCSV